MSTVSKAIGAAVGAGIGLFVTWGVLPDDFASVNKELIDAAVLLVSSFVGTYFAPKNAE